MTITTRELPDVETLIVHYLKDITELEDAGVKMIVGPAAPNHPTYPMVRIHRSGGPAVIPFWLDAGRYQVDVWGTEDTAQLRSITTRVYAALVELPAVYDEGVVTGIEETVGRAYVPDPVSGRPRYLFEVRVFAHPNP